ncbi:hypothetical protein MXF49_22855 [Klebsiella pneumoniae]|uniref:hypothetical protein n=1 Tax=Klebsiella pneumoniae TaxID=573 RepID=UPI002DB7CFE1|nr:hypothetical protein [Klebsiella pneumoniae]MEB6168522.1 hypothetical protein [Klebsiella pneumoniae]
MKFLMFVAPCAAVITKPTIRKVTNAKRKRNSMTKLNVISAVSKAQTQAALTTAARITPMTDITELAQSEINDALAQLKQISEYPTPSTQYARVLRKYIATQVEALEKAHAVMNAVVTAAAIRGVRPFDGIDCDPPTLEENAEACGDAMSARIRELEANPPKPHHNGLMQISNELASAKQRIAELDSRAVNVENLQESAYRAGLTAGWNLGLANNNDGFNKCLAAHAAGIKVEAE